MSRDAKTAVAKMNIYQPMFIPLYIFLVLVLAWWSSKLAVDELRRGLPEISWSGVVIVLAGFGFVNYVEYSKRFQYKGYTKEEVLKRNSMETGVWLVVNNDVFDVTDFVKKHPPGPNKILNLAGKDATRHYQYHLEGTKHFWRRAKIGWIIDSEETA